MATTTIKLRRRQLGKEARPCSHGVISARCQEQEETTERTRRRMGSNQGYIQPYKTSSSRIKGVDKRRE